MSFSLFLRCAGTGTGLEITALHDVRFRSKGIMIKNYKQIYVWEHSVLLTSCLAFSDVENIYYTFVPPHNPDSVLCTETHKCSVGNFSQIKLRPFFLMVAVTLIFYCEGNVHPYTYPSCSNSSAFTSKRLNQHWEIPKYSSHTDLVFSCCRSDLNF